MAGGLQQGIPVSHATFERFLVYLCHKIDSIPIGFGLFPHESPLSPRDLRYCGLLRHRTFVEVCWVIPPTVSRADASVKWVLVLGRVGFVRLEGGRVIYGAHTEEGVVSLGESFDRPNGLAILFPKSDCGEDSSLQVFVR